MPRTDMHLGASPVLFVYAKTMRKTPTTAEQLLWQQLRNKQVLGLHFRFQHPLLYFIADFYCHAIRLIIEVDGSIHNLPSQYQYDELRTLELSNYGITVLRFKNEDVINHIQIVLEEINKQAQTLLSIQTPL